MNSDTSDIETQLREAIMSASMSQYRIAKDSGVAKSQLSLFLSGQRSLTLTSAAKIARALGLELRPIRRKAR